jgi:hypothetical protein
MSRVSCILPKRQASLPRDHVFAGLQTRAEKSVLNNAIGALWLACIGGAISMRDARRLDRALKRAGGRVAELPEWFNIGSRTKH